MIRDGKRTLRPWSAAALVVLAAWSASAPSSAARSFAPLHLEAGEFRSASQLPPGRLRTQLESLPAKAQAKAIRALQRLSITHTDLATLRIGPAGDLYFVEPPLRASPAVRKAVANGQPVPQWSASDTFKLHSRPGAPNRLLLDFDGHTLTGTVWNANAGRAFFFAVAYSLDADRTTFNADERAAIIAIWHRVAEDLAPFDIDVTTEQPATMDARTGRVLITEDTDANGVQMPSFGWGGVAQVDVFGTGSYHTYYSPALVYANNLGHYTSVIAEASSHEFGHNLGLSHDGTTTGTTYYEGHGSGLVSWAPIMGNSYGNNVTEWSKGEYPLANQAQDDLAIIAAKLGNRPDDAGDTAGAGAPLAIAPDGAVDASNPELDPFNLLPQNKGVIGARADVDVYTFNAGAGPLALTATPAWDAFYSGTEVRGANLDLRLELRDAANGVVATGDPDTDTGATVSATVPAGTYHLFVSGVGNAASPYSDYASLGEYFINGTVTPSTPLPTLSIADVAIAEGNGGTATATFTVVLSKPAAAPVTYRIATSNATALAGSDYVAASLAAQTIPVGATRATFRVTIKADAAVEANEVFLVTASNVAGAAVADGVAKGTILNDDGPTLSIGDATLVEGDGGSRVLHFAVRLSTPAAGPVKFNIATVAGTAKANVDYVGRSLVGQVIPAGATVFPFDVTVLGDAQTESFETFAVRLNAVTGATLFDGEATGTILDDDRSASLATGYLHSCALIGGAVKCWGHNAYGQLGNGTNAPHLMPAAVSGLPSGVVAIAAGHLHTCALTGAGGVKCWGWNGHGQLGDGSTANRWTPVPVSGLDSGVVAITAGYDHTCALTGAGAVKCWGWGIHGQIGDGTSTNRPSPVAVSGLSSGVVAIAAGYYHTCAVTDGGAVRCWGLNDQSQLGDDSATNRATPVPVSHLADGVVAVAAGQGHTCALTSAGAMKCWGYNGFGQLGDGSAATRRVPVDVGGLAGGVLDLELGYHHTCARIAGGAMQCWGWNANGQLGDDSVSSRNAPTAVVGLGSGVTAISAGRAHTCAAIDDGVAVECWGANASGQLGDDTTTQRQTPVPVPGL